MKDRIGLIVQAILILLALGGAYGTLSSRLGVMETRINGCESRTEKIDAIARDVAYIRGQLDQWLPPAK